LRFFIVPGLGAATISRFHKSEPRHAGSPDFLE
jgi:hypothetical protein